MSAPSLDRRPEQLCGPAPKSNKLYWRLKRDVTDGSVGWNVGWKVGNPAPGLIEIADSPNGPIGRVLSVDELDILFAT